MFNDGAEVGAHRGLYCLWANGSNSVVAFEGRDGALRYALELKAQGLGLPRPTRVAVKVIMGCVGREEDGACEHCTCMW